MTFYGAAHVKGLYTVPTASGTQFTDGCDVIWNLGMRTLKVYCTGTYTADYALQTAWSSTPTTLTELVQTDEFADQLERDWRNVVLTCFTFANGQTNWWRVEPTNARLLAEYTEIKALAVHLLTTYSGTGKRFILQNWEGDWAFMDSVDPTTPVPKDYIRRYAAFLNTRQRAVTDARRETAFSDVEVLHAVELNRVTDRKIGGRTRIINSLGERIDPDVISLSAYDPLIVSQGSWGANYAAWRAATEPVYRESLRAIKAAWPNKPFYVGEFGYPENEQPAGADIPGMIADTNEWTEDEGGFLCIYWEVFDNEAGAGPPTYRGYWLRDDAGDLTEAGTWYEAALAAA